MGRLIKRARIHPPEKEQVFPGLLDHLPNDILVCLASELSQQDALSLAKANSRCYHLVISQIYRANVTDEGSDALLWGICHGNLGTVKYALAAGADPNSLITTTTDCNTGKRWPPGRPRPTATHVRGSGRVLRLPLLCKYSNMPLDEAAKRGDVDAARALLDAGARIAQTATAGRQPMAPLFSAAHFGNIELLELLLTAQGADISSAQDRDGLLISAIQGGSVAMTKHVLKGFTKPPADSCPVIRHAVVSEHRDVLRYLLSTGKFDVNQADVNGSTPLMAAINSDSDSEALHLLIRQPGIDVAAEDNTGRSAITLALEFGKEEYANTLLRHPGVVFDPFSAFVAAGRSGLYKVTNYLLNSKHVPKTPCRVSGRTWMHAAARRNLAASITILNGLDKTMINAKCTGSGNTPLMEAARSNHCRETFKKLLRFKPDLDTTNSRGETALHMSCAAGNVHDVEDLLERGADFNIKNHLGQTPLHVAAARVGADKVGIVRLLVGAGASVQEPDLEERSPLEIASAEEFENIVSEMYVQLEVSDAELLASSRDHNPGGMQCCTM